MVSAANYHGSDSFTFRANDGTGDSNVATITLTVTPVNDAPVATNGSASTAEDTALTNGSLAATDVDGDTLTYSKVADPSHGTVVVNANGSFTYTPAANYNGGDSFTFKANDGTGDSNVATVTLTVTAANDAPVAASASFTTPLATPLNGSVTATDAEGATLTYSLVGGPTNGILVLNSNGTFSYTPLGLLHESDTFTFKANDGSLDSNTATITITVDSLPVAVDDSGTAVGGVAVINVIANDSDPDGILDTLTVTADVSVTANNGLVVCVLGVCTYTAEVGFQGTDTFTYTLTDSVGATDTATVTVTVP